MGLQIEGGWNLQGQPSGPRLGTSARRGLRRHLCTGMSNWEYSHVHGHRSRTRYGHLATRRSNCILPESRGGGRLCKTCSWLRESRKDDEIKQSHFMAYINQAKIGSAQLTTRWRTSDSYRHGRTRAFMSTYQRTAWSCFYYTSTMF